MAFIPGNSLTVLLAVATAVSFAWIYIMRKRLGVGLLGAFVLAVVHTLFGVLAVRAFAIIEGFGDLSTVGSMSLYGGMAFMPLLYLLVIKLTQKPAKDVFDILTVSLVSTLFFARINCMLAGCCLGAHVFAFDQRWPTREFELIYYIWFLAIYVPSVYEGTGDGKVFPTYMVSYGLFRFVIEFLRESTRAVGPFHISHLWSLVAIGLGMVILSEMASDKRERKVRS